jgi:hypothetical protein
MSQNARKAGQPQPRESDLVKGLQEEIAKLRRSLAEVEAERDLYRKAVYEYSRGALHFESVDIPELERISGGPVQTLE